jgi:hypothetical protein
MAALSNRSDPENSSGIEKCISSSTKLVSSAIFPKCSPVIGRTLGLGLGL